MDNKILLTGASGFVGTHLLKKLSTLGYTMDAVSTSDNPIQLIKNTYSWQNLTEINGPYSIVIHLAGLAHDTANKNEEKAYYDVNVGLTEKILNQLDNWKTEKFIYLSSIKAMVDSFSDEIIDENSAITPTQVYGLSKLKAEQSIQSHSSIAKKYIFRPVLIYGPQQKGNLKILEKLINWSIPIPLTQWKNQRSLLYIENLVFCICKTIEKEIENGVYLVADDKPISTYSIVDAIAKGKNKIAIGFGLPSLFFRFLLQRAPDKIKLLLNKVLGSLAVDNSKLKKALKINAMPYSTKDSFYATYNNKKN